MQINNYRCEGPEEPAYPVATSCLGEISPAFNAMTQSDANDFPLLRTEVSFSYKAYMSRPSWTKISTQTQLYYKVISTQTSITKLHFGTS